MRWREWEIAPDGTKVKVLRYERLGEISRKNAVEKLAPYSTNKQALATNAEDSFASAAATTTYDPFVEYALLGKSLSDGIIAWITVAVLAVWCGRLGDRVVRVGGRHVLRRRRRRAGVALLLVTDVLRPVELHLGRA